MDDQRTERHGGSMTLREIINTVETLDDDDTVFVQARLGEILPESQAAVVYISDEDLRLPTKTIADKQCPGMEYLLEGSIVKEVVSWAKSTVKAPSADETLAAVIYYAQHDAYPKDYG